MKTYVKFLISLFSITFIKAFLVFFILILVTNILEQIDFFKGIDVGFSYLIFLSILNAPSVIFEILPFIFLISTQVFFITLIDKNELGIFKYSGLNNYKIIKIIGSYTFILGLIFIILFYNISSIMKKINILMMENIWL